MEMVRFNFNTTKCSELVFKFVHIEKNGIYVFKKCILLQDR